MNVDERMEQKMNVKGARKNVNCIVLWCVTLMFVTDGRKCNFAKHEKMNKHPERLKTKEAD